MKSFLEKAVSSKSSSREDVLSDLLAEIEELKSLLEESDNNHKKEISRLEEIIASRPIVIDRKNDIVPSPS